MDLKSNVRSPDTLSGLMPKKVAGRQAHPKAQKLKPAAIKAPWVQKVIIVDYDEETYTRFQALVASYARPKASAEAKKETKVP